MYFFSGKQTDFGPSGTHFTSKDYFGSKQGFLPWVGNAEKIRFISFDDVF